MQTFVRNLGGRASWPLIFIAVLVLGLPALGQDAAATFKAKCAMCHGPDGKGETPIAKKLGAQDLGSPAVQKQSDPDLLQAITKGKNKMPAFESKLKQEEIKSLVAYVRQFGKSR